MKKILVSIGVALAVLVMGVKSQAETYATTLSGGTNATLLLLGPGKLNSISISSLATTNGTLNFYDSPYITNTIIVAAFTNLTVSTALYTNYITNIYGVLNTNYYTKKVYTTNTLAAGARLRPLILSAQSVSNSVQTFDFDGVYFGQGLLVTNQYIVGGLGGIGITVNYDKLR